MTSSAPTQALKQPIGESRRHCPICRSPHLEYEFVIDKHPLCSCSDCGLLFLNPLPVSPPTSWFQTPQFDSALLNNIHQANAKEILRRLMAYSEGAVRRLLLVGADPALNAITTEAGLSIECLSPAEFEAQQTATMAGTFDACLLFCALERMRDPLAALKSLKLALVHRGTLVVVSPTLDDLTARSFKHSWWRQNRGNYYYFSVDTLQSLLLKAGFGDPYIVPDKSMVASESRLEQLARPSAQATVGRTKSIPQLPSSSGGLRYKAVTGRSVVLSRSVQMQQQCRLSVIVPVFNERATCKELLDQLLAKTIEDVEIEVIIVESNSTDGSRDLVSEYHDHPRVKLLLEERPSGKGHAVRTGLKAATGQVILFQDADLEYDLNDYDALVLPLFRCQGNFILGSRHSNSSRSWKIRNFSDSPGLSGVFNFGHLIFLTLFNTLYSQRLSDPFTMYKVFRRECLYGLNFECNRFDFDYEIVIKLLRKGYQPRELPVNYTSRSIAEGKKVTLFRDPITWVKALLKFKKSPLYATEL